MIYVKSCNDMLIKPFEQGYQNQMMSCCQYLWNTLFRSNQDDKQRASNLINLGLTNRRLDKLRRITITGRVGLNLIETSTKTISLDSNALKGIGRLLMYVIDECLPHTPYANVFKSTNKYEREYLQLFGKQLLLEGNELSRFCFPAISILVNKDLNPHCDSMNPMQLDVDYTFSLSVQVPITKVPIILQKQIQHLYPYTVPMCLVIYKRKALVYYCKRMLSVDTYINEVPHKKVGRQKLVEMIRRVGTYADYQGMFFNRTNRTQIEKSFNDINHNTYQGKISKVPEAVDKMVSCTIHEDNFIYFNFN